MYYQYSPMPKQRQSQQRNYGKSPSNPNTHFSQDRISAKRMILTRWGTGEETDDVSDYSEVLFLPFPRIW